MAYNPQWADSFRAALAAKGSDGITEKAMFGGLCFLDRGNMLGGIGKTDFMFRVGKEQEAEALKRDGARPIDFNGRKMGGMLFVEPQAAMDNLPEWLDLCFAFTGTFPAK